MVAKKIDDAIKFMDGVKADRAAKQLYEDPAYNCDLIIGTINGLKKDTEGIFNLPPPKAKSEEKPKEGEAPTVPEPPKEEKDWEMPTMEDKAEDNKPDVEMQNDEQKTE
jgi:hypothetical protein